MLARTMPLQMLATTQPLLRRTQPAGDNLGSKPTTPHWRQGFGNVRHVPRNYDNATSKYRSKQFKMKKHRYTKRWRMNRYKLAALANMPFNRKIRLHMLPKLTQGTSSTGRAGSSELDLDGMSKVVDVAAQRASADGGQRGKFTRARPPSKYM